MFKTLVLLLLLHALMPCKAYFASPLITLNARSTDTSNALRQAAQVLNVAEPGNWAVYMDPPSTSGSTGQAQVGTATLSTVMAGWSIPDQFRAQAIQKVNLLVLAAAEGTYNAQAFVFDVPSGASLSTLIVVTQRIASPTDPNSPVQIGYVSINSNAGIKQQYTPYNERNCHRCPKCVWTSKCCCHDETKYAPRGNTQDELSLILNKMKVEQYRWFSQQTLSRTLKKRALLSYSNNNNQHTALVLAIQKYLSNRVVLSEVLSSYNDSLLSTLQSHIGSLKLSSESLKLAKVTSENVPIVLSSLAEEYGFEEDFTNSKFTQQLQTGRASYENLFTTSTNNNKQIYIKFIWLIGQRLDNSTYSINFLFMNITSEILLDALLSNGTNTTTTDVITPKQLKIVRTSLLNDQGEFINEYLSTLIAPWKVQTTKTVLNILRFVAASTLYPQQGRMLSYLQTEINAKQARVEPVTLDLKIKALAQAVSAAAGAWKDIVTAFKSSKSTTITRIVRFGFTYFNQKSSVLKAIDIPAAFAREFINAVVIDYSLPAKGSFALGLTYSADFAWDRTEYLYSPAMNGSYRSVTIFKNGDSVSNTASFFIVDIDADWQLAPDLLLIQTSKSYLGGLFESNKQSIQEVPHVLTLDEAQKLQQFFMLIAMGNIASTLSLNVTIPPLE